MYWTQQEIAKLKYSSKNIKINCINIAYVLPETNISSNKLASKYSQSNSKYINLKCKNVKQDKDQECAVKATIKPLQKIWQKVQKT